jgi:hypothetical protein
MATPETLTGTQRTYPLLQVARRIVVPALVLGSLAAAAAGFAQVNGHQSAATTHVAVSASSDSANPNPWMY